MKFEIWLAVAIVGLYLLDSVSLLYANEFVFYLAGNRWKFTTAHQGVQVLRRYLYIPNPLAPYRPLFRAAWSAAAAEYTVRTLEPCTRYVAVLLPIQLSASVLLGLIILGAPVLLLARGAGTPFLTLVALVYLVIIGMLAYIYVKRDTLALSRGNLAELVIDSILCPPLAINVVRKITLGRALRADAVAYARSYFDVSEFQHFIAAICSQVDERLELEEEGSDQYLALTAYRNKLESLNI